MKAYRFLLLLLLLIAVPAVALENAPQTVQSGITGQVMINDKTPMTNGVVLLYSDNSGPPPNPYKYWRIPDYVFATDGQGRFSVPLDEGTYFLMIAQKKMDGEIGPPLDSEYLYYHADSEGNARPIVVTADAVVNLGKLQGSFYWTPAMSERTRGITAIEGVVMDMENRPVDNVVVLAFYTREARRRPAFISDRTDRNGRFSLRVAEGGDYWLRVRGVIGGGAPEAGERLNTTDEFDPIMVSPESGKKVTGILLRVKVFDGIGSTGKPKPEKKWMRVNDIKPGTPAAPAGKK